MALSLGVATIPLKHYTQSLAQEIQHYKRGYILQGRKITGKLRHKRANQREDSKFRRIRVWEGNIVLAVIRKTSPYVKEQALLLPPERLVLQVGIWAIG